MIKYIEGRIYIQIEEGFEKINSKNLFGTLVRFF